MTDPFEPLRGHEADVRPPSVEAIRRRVERTRRRRQAAAAGSAGLVAVLAVLALVTLPGDGEESSRLAAGSETSPPATTAPTSGPTEGPDAPAVEPQSAPSSEEEGARLDSPEGSRSAATGRTGGEDAAADSARPGPEALEAAVEGPDRPVAAGEEARFTLRVCNPRSEAVEVFFEDAQRYDFHVSRGGERVWTWSAGRAFAQVASSERWEPDACRTWTETWSGRSDEGNPTPPGRYEVVGLLASDPEVRSGRVEFCMGACP